MAHRLQSKIGLLSPFVSEKYFAKLARRVLNTPWFTKNTAKESSQERDEERSVEDIAKKVTEKNFFKRDPSLVEVESVYKTLPNAKTALKQATPEPRFIWKECADIEQDFPPSPEEAAVDIMTYLEQRDCFSRLQKLQAQEFCVGSIVAVTRADPYVPRGKIRFVGLCIAKNHWQNTLGATFTLRNVVDGEPMEVNFQLYSPNLQKIEVLRHEKRDQKTLWHLRDYPPNNSYVSETIEALPYTKEPSTYVQSKEDKLRIEKWFRQIRKRKQRR